MEIFSQIILSALTGLGGIAAAYIRTMSKDVRLVNENMKDLTYQVKMSVQELRMDLDHVNEKVSEVKDRVKFIEKGDANVRNSRNTRSN